jgi:predicted NAD/FAD-dependent oxidoreductase
LYGAAAAAKIREQNPDAKIKVWDAARGTGGKAARWVATTHTGAHAVADMGAQVLNCNMAYGPAVREVEELTKCGILSRAHALANTEERPSRSSTQDISAFWAKKGTSEVCRHYLKQAQLDELCLNKRATNITSDAGNRWRVHADVGEVGDPYADHNVVDNVQETFDVVVTALPAYELVNVGGLASFMPEQLNRALGNMQYDRRYAVGLCFKPALKIEIERWMGQKAELLVDDGVIHLVANQAAKRVQEYCMLVVHTARQYQVNSSSSEFRSEVMLAVMNSLASQMGQPIDKLRQLLHAYKVIDWRQCSVMETIPGYQGAALLSIKPRLIMAGDYFSVTPGCTMSAIVQSGYAVAAAFAHQQDEVTLASIPMSPRGHGGVDKRVLIVGAGPSGCMLAAQLRRRFPDVHLSVWECARGVSGRAASKRFEVGGEKEVILDMGTQVLSATSAPDVLSEIEHLHSVRLIQKAQGLGITEERGPNGGNDPNVVHWWARDGISAVYRKYLEEGEVEELRFGTRVSSLSRSGDQWLVSGMKGDVGDPHAEFNVKGHIQQTYDAVVLAMAPHDLMRIAGVPEAIAPDVGAQLQTLQTD